MVWVFAVLAFVAGLGIVVHTNRWRFERRVADEIRALLAVPHSALALPRVDGLPPPVARYRQLARTIHQEAEGPPPGGSLRVGEHQRSGSGL